MIQNKVTVYVSASFEDQFHLFQTLKKYSQTADNRFAYWDEFAFTTQPLSECDAILVLNTPAQYTSLSCYRESVIAFMMEPGDKMQHPWMFKGLDQYEVVYSPIKVSPNIIASHGYLGWYFNQDYHFFNNLAVPEKTKAISCIASNLNLLEGHRRRLEFIAGLKQDFPQIDFFGKGDHFIPEKMDGLLPYKYSIAIENTSLENYFTEKINDCFLTYTVPMYAGCRNISKYFPERAYIQIDLDDKQAAMKKIRELLHQDDWTDRLPSIIEARDLVLNKYQPLAGASAILRHKHVSEKKTINLKPVKQTFLTKLKSRLDRLLKAKA